GEIMNRSERAAFTCDSKDVLGEVGDVPTKRRFKMNAQFTVLTDQLIDMLRSPGHFRVNLPERGAALWLGFETDAETFLELEIVVQDRTLDHFFRAIDL
ncbi:MAG: hypothetical protein ACK56I_32585, partial [bacterium]